MTTFLQLTNDVLARMRQATVATVATSPYTILIGKFVNDAKRQVEDAWTWDALSTTLSLSTVSGTSNYVLTGSGLRQRQATVNDTANLVRLGNAPIKWIQDQQQLTTTVNAQPIYYAWNGSNGTDSKVELWPTPNAAYVLKFNLYVPQVELSLDADVLLIPSEAVAAGAYARALVERGEDGGLSSSEAYGLYKGILADQIAIESARFIENDAWVPT